MMMESPQFSTLAQSLVPILQNLEFRRKELRWKGHKKGMLMGILSLIMGIVILFAFKCGLIWAYVLILVISIGVYFASVSTKSKELSVYYKKQVIAQMLQALCENATLTPEKGISESSFKDCGLFASPDRYHTEDLIEGCVDKTNFICAEVHAEEKRTQVNAKGQVRHYWVDIFKGFMFVADYSKDFKGHTNILRDDWLKLNGGGRVKLENPNFENKFDVYSTDQIEARYLITPSMMERLLTLEAHLNKKFIVSFRNSKIIIAIHETKNHFEASIWKPINDIGKLQDDFCTIRALISIIDDLNLNTRIWTKE